MVLKYKLWNHFLNLKKNIIFEYRYLFEKYAQNLKYKKGNRNLSPVSFTHFQQSFIVLLFPHNSSKSFVNASTAALTASFLINPSMTSGAIVAAPIP